MIGAVESCRVEHSGGMRTICHGLQADISQWGSFDS